MNELAFRTLLVQKLKEIGGQDLHAVKIESTASVGVPDLNICYCGKEIWAELKVAEHNRVKIRPMQVSWTQARLAAGGNVKLIVGDKDDKNLRVRVYEGYRILSLAAVSGKLDLFSVPFDSRPVNWSLLLKWLFPGA